MVSTLLTPRQREIADRLFEVGAVKFGAFKIKAHDTNADLPPSPVYFNLRTRDHPTKKDGKLTPEIMELVGQEFNALIDRLGMFDHFADIPDAGKPFGDQFGHVVRNDVTRLTLKKIIRQDGTRFIASEVEGEFFLGDSCVLVDELISQARSKIQAIIALCDAGLIVRHAVALIDLCQGGAEELRQHKCTLHSVLTLPAMLEYYAEKGKITPEKKDEVLTYLASNSL